MPQEWDVGLFNKKHHRLDSEPREYKGIPVRIESEYRKHRHSYDKPGQRERWL